MKSVKNLKDFLFTEDTVNDTMIRTTLIIKINVAIMCGYFLMVMISFFGLGNLFIPICSAVCFIAFLLMFYLITPSRLKFIRISQTVLTLIFMALFVVMYGWWGGIQQFILSNVVMLYTTGPNNKMKRVLYVVSLGIYRLLIYLYSLHFTTLAVVPKGASVYFQVLNTLAVYVMIALSLGIYVTDSREAVRQLMVSQQTNQLSQMIDLLTGLYNRKAITHHLEDTAYTAEETGEAFSIAIMDVDRFGDINTKYGQKEGDVILRQLGNQMKETLGDKGNIGRWSGTSFLLVLDGIPVKETGSLIQRLQEKARSMEFLYQMEPINLTVSFALQEYIQGKDLNETLSTAEKKLRKAKDAGGNTIVSH
jgi:diguanylate cyclase (GGDEF)-like protein